MDINRIIEADCIDGMKLLPDACVDCCVTSPPYYGLRDYNHQNQIGLEESPEAYVEKLTQVFNEVRRVLKANGTLWLNLGDSYANSGNGAYDKEYKSRINGKGHVGLKPIKHSLKPKDLIGIPWMVAFSLRSSGWYLRQDIIWSKPNPMPESVTDRCTKSHEYIFLLTKSRTYYFDNESIKTEGKNPKDDFRRSQMQKPENKYAATEIINGIRPRKSGNTARKDGSERGCPQFSGSNVNSHVPWEGVKSNKRSVWTVGTRAFPDAHFATFPQMLIVDCIKAGCPENGIVLDPFMGGGTTAVVARKLNRKFIGFELNESYIKIANKRLNQELGIFLNPIL